VSSVHDRQRGHGLARATLPDQAQGLPAPDAEADIVDDALRAGAGVELDAESAHVEDDLAAAAVRPRSGALARLPETWLRARLGVGRAG